MSNPYLEFDGIGRNFPGVRALDAVTFAAAEGSVHALIGENGAGKSTLLKILGGALAPDDGEIRLQGRPVRFASTGDALAAGIAVIHQELQLVPEMSVAENLFLGHLPSRGGWINRRRLREMTLRQLDALEERIDPFVKVSRLPIAQRQMVEIAKALARGAKVLAFDEPTSSLTDREVRKLFSIIRDLRRQGKVILYVSHRMDEIFEICDAVTVFRDGRHIETFDSMDRVTRDLLVNRMVGRDIRDIYDYAPRPHGGPALEVDGVSGPGLSAPASLSVAQGEILGMFGLVGAGRSELLQLIYGARPKRSGALRLMGKPVSVHSPADAIRHGIMLCPEDRKREGILPVRSVRENINLSARRRHTRMRFAIDAAWEERNAAEQVRRLAIKTPSLRQLAANLSGGNQQKTILARWLSENVRVMLLDEPTRGIDVGAKSEIYAIMYDLARQGVGLIVASSDMPEILGISDRILVMREGCISASVLRAEATDDLLLRLALPSGSHAEPLTA